MCTKIHTHACACVCVYLIQYKSATFGTLPWKFVKLNLKGKVESYIYIHFQLITESVNVFIHISIFPILRIPQSTCQCPYQRISLESIIISSSHTLQCCAFSWFFLYWYIYYHKSYSIYEANAQITLIWRVED